MNSSVIDLVEAAYNLEVGAADWLPNLLEAGGSALDLGLGCAAAIWAGVSEGQPLITQMRVHAGPEELALRFARAAQQVGPRLGRQTSQARAGAVNVASRSRRSCPRICDALTAHVGCKDILGVWALDPDLHGVALNIPSSTTIRLSRSRRARWQMLAVHLAAGHRLRRALGKAGHLRGTPVTDIPLCAEALIDPTRFLVSDAVGVAQDKAASQVLREAAIRIDRARGDLRRQDSEEALRLWQGLVRGRWSLVDWFDTDGRRFLLAKPNPPNIGDPRGLSEREYQVATYAALGESGKLTGYRLGISPARVSCLLRGAMRKLRVRTQAQLVVKMRGFSGLQIDG